MQRSATQLSMMPLHKAQMSVAQMSAERGSLSRCLRRGTSFLFCLFFLLAGCAGSGNYIGSRNNLPIRENVPAKADRELERPERRIVGSAANSRVTGNPVYKIGTPYTIEGKTYYPALDYDYDQTGISSWYGDAFAGKTTANGEIFDPNLLTAAHRTLPMPSLIEVTNLANNRVIILRLNDRGPYARNRILDVSRRAAFLLGFVNQGTTPVRVRVLEDASKAMARRLGANPEINQTLPSPVIVGAGSPKPSADETLALFPPEENDGRTETGNKEPADFGNLDSLTAPPEGGLLPDELEFPEAGNSFSREFSPEGNADQNLLPEEELVITPLPAPGAPAPSASQKQGDSAPLTGKIFIQIGAFIERENIQRALLSLDSLGYTASVSAVDPSVPDDQTLYRVRLGPIDPGQRKTRDDTR